MTTFTTSPTSTNSALELGYPMSLWTYSDYGQAQRLVAYLSDRNFPVENVAIVGTELRSVERVTGRLTRGKLAAAAALSGLWMGLFGGIALAVFRDYGQLGFLITTPLLGAAFGLIWSQLGFKAATQRGARDFSSIRQVVATRYE